MRLLNRVVPWLDEGLTWAHDPRHCALSWSELGLDLRTTTAFSAPGSRDNATHTNAGGSVDGDAGEYLCEGCNCVHDFDQELVAPGKLHLTTREGSY